MVKRSKKEVRAAQKTLKQLARKRKKLPRVVIDEAPWERRMAVNCPQCGAALGLQFAEEQTRAVPRGVILLAPKRPGKRLWRCKCGYVALARSVPIE